MKLQISKVRLWWQSTLTAHATEDDEPIEKRKKEDSSSDEEYVLWSRRIQLMMKKNLFSISALDKKGCSCDWWRRRDTQIYEDLFNNVDHEQDKHKSSELDDEEKHTVRDSIYSCKETRINRDSTHQTNKDKCLNFHFLYI